MKIVIWGIGSLVVAVALAVGAPGVFAQYDYSKSPASGSLADELKTALTHVGFAQKYDTMKEVTLHLHHTLNCLVGPKDAKMFNAAAGNPCEGQGNGVVADLQNSSKDIQQEARWAAHIADEALTMKTIEEVKGGAHIVALALEDIQKKAK